MEADLSETRTPFATVFQNALSPDIHVKLDEHARPLSFVPFDSAAAWILSTVLNASVSAYSTTIWPINPAVITTEVCETLLASNRELRGLLEEAHRSGQYSEIRNRHEFHKRKNIEVTPSSSRTSDADAVRKRIDKFVDELRPALKQVFNKPRISIWMPPENVDEDTRRFYHNLAIPAIGDNMPSLLLHHVANHINPNVSNLFRAGDHHRILSNTSGAGKTALIFQGLCQQWGFYFVAAQDTNKIGHRDLESMIGSMEFSLGWNDDIFEDPNATSIEKGNIKNEKIAFNRVLKVMLARWIVFRTFVEVATAENAGKLPDNIKYDWLLFQILPLVLIKDKDPFIAFMNAALVGVSTEVLQDFLTALTPTEVLGSAYDATRDSFFYVLDEAQVAGKRYTGAFSDGTTRRPVLRPIIRAWASSPIQSVRFIVSGTGFSLSLFKTVLTLGVGKDSPTWDVVHTTGDFMNRGDQESYITRYLPAAFLSSPSGCNLVKRVHDWLRGRHRFTARFIEELLRGNWMVNGPGSPHKLLNAYVHEFTTFVPIDGNRSFLDLEPECRELKIDGFPWEKLDQDPQLLRELSTSMYIYMTRGVYPMWDKDRRDLVEYGIARFVGAGDKVNIGEPMSLVSIVRHLETRNLTFEEDIRLMMKANKGQAFEEAVLLSCTRIFGGQGARLDEVFQFYGDTPDWARQVGRIVTLGADGTFQGFNIVNADPVIPSTGVAFYAEGPRDVEHWLAAKHHGWCLPGPLMGPDLMAWLQLADGRLILLLEQSKVRLDGNKDTVDADVTAHAIESLSPKNFYRGQHKKEVKHMLAAINKREDAFTSGDFNILRVVAAYPLDVNLHSRSKFVKAALLADRHPLATLKRATLLSSLATSDSTPTILSDLISSMKRSREASGQDSVIGQPSRKVRRKTK